MAHYTDNLNLYEKDPTTDGDQLFSISTMMNDNYDKIDTAVGNLGSLTTSAKTNIVGAINEVNAKDALPSQSGHSGKYLTTNGTSALWSAIEALPSQSGQSGKILTTDGTNASWGTTGEIIPMITSYVDDTLALGYNIWANGYCEQWGSIQPTATSLNYPVSFIKEFKDTNYVITTNVANASAWSSTSSTVGGDSIVLWAGFTNRKTSEGFYFARVVAGNITMWKACGYLAEGQY